MLDVSLIILSVGILYLGYQGYVEREDLRNFWQLKWDFFEIENLPVPEPGIEILKTPLMSNFSTTVAKNNIENKIINIDNVLSNYFPNDELTVITKAALLKEELSIQNTI